MSLRYFFKKMPMYWKMKKLFSFRYILLVHPFILAKEIRKEKEFFRLWINAAFFLISFADKHFGGCILRKEAIRPKQYNSCKNKNFHNNMFLNPGF